MEGSRTLFEKVTSEMCPARGKDPVPQNFRLDFQKNRITSHLRLWLIGEKFVEKLRRTLLN